MSASDQSSAARVPAVTRGAIASALARVGRYILIALLALYFAAAGLFLVLRLVLLPQVDAFRPQIAELIGRAIGLPVDIDALSADWSGLRPRLHLTGFALRDAEGRPALRLEAVDATLAWSSALRARPYFHRLEIHAPDLALRREPDGSLFVAGMKVEQKHDGGDGFATWLLAQREIVIRGATLSWNDHQRGAPELRLADVEFRLYRRGSRHRFGLQAQPPVELASRLDLRGNFAGVAEGDPAVLDGELYLEMERTELGGWRPWVDYPVALAGLGGVRAWIDVAGGQPAGIVADLALDAVRARLAPELPELGLASLRGRLGAAFRGGTMTVESRGLAFRTTDGLALPPTDLDIAVERDRSGATTGGHVRVNALDIEVLSRLAAYLPFDPSVHERLGALQPEGRVSDLRVDWRGPVAAPQSWKLHARVDGIGLAAREAVPGVGGLDGLIDGDDQSGRFRVAGHDVWLDLPRVFPDPRLKFSALEAEGGWQRRDGSLEIVLDRAQFENPDASGSASGQYRLADGGPGVIDLSARLVNADGAAVWRYMPLVVNAETRDWLRRSIVGGVAPEARLRLRGDLARFPFRDGREGQFLVTARMAGARLEYAPGWPAIDSIDGELRFEGASMLIRAERGNIFGVKLAKVAAELPDLQAHGAQVLTIRGQASGPTADFLRFVAESPVAQRVGRFTAGLQAEGAGTLDLVLTMPLHHIDGTEVRGNYRFAGNRLRVVDGLPPLEEATGRLEFTRDRMVIPEASARLLGAPMQLSTRAHDDGGVSFLARGRASVGALGQIHASPLLEQLSGSTPWQAEIAVRPGGTRVAVRSDLTGIASSLPEPLNKPAADSWPLEVDVEYPADSGRQLIRVQLAERVGLEIDRRHGAAGWVVERGGLGVFEPVRKADGGILVAARLPALDADAWRRALEPGGAAADDHGTPTADMLPLAGIAMQVDAFRVFGQTLHGFDLRAIAEREGWKGRVLSREAEGEFDWRSLDEGALRARFRRLALDAGADDASAPPGDDVPPRRLPGLDIVVDRFQLRGLDLGRLELMAKNRGGQWLLDSLAVTNPDGRLSGSGSWRPGSDPRTQLDFRLESADVGRLIQRFGYPDAVKQGSTVLAGAVEWRGAPTDIDYPSLSGRMELEVGKGQFNQLDPGVGRLLGVLNLQALPRRITLDFRDVFSEGFAFDRITGHIEMASGVMRTDDLEIRGPAARVLMKGAADVAAETQDIKVTVQPTLAESVAIGAAAGLINPVAGVVTYLAQKALNDPIEKLFAYEYGVTGTWADPKVEKLRAPVKQSDAEVDGHPGLPAPRPVP